MLFRFTPLPCTRRSEQTRPARLWNERGRMKSYWIACSIAMVVAGVQEVQKPSPPDAPSVQTNAPASTDSRKTHKRVHADLSGFDLAPKSAATDSGVQIG